MRDFGTAGATGHASPHADGSSDEVLADPVAGPPRVARARSADSAAAHASAATMTPRAASAGQSSARVDATAAVDPAPVHESVLVGGQASHGEPQPTLDACLARLAQAAETEPRAFVSILVELQALVLDMDMDAKEARQPGWRPRTRTILSDSDRDSPAETVAAATSPRAEARPLCQAAGAPMPRPRSSVPSAVAPPPSPRSSAAGNPRRLAGPSDTFGSQPPLATIAWSEVEEVLSALTYGGTQQASPARVAAVFASVPGLCVAETPPADGELLAPSEVSDIVEGVLSPHGVSSMMQLQRVTLAVAEARFPGRPLPAALSSLMSARGFGGKLLAVCRAQLR